MRVAQISDCHLFAEDSARLMGYDTYREFDKVISELERRHAAELDALLVTGDISQDESRASYDRFARRLQSVGLPVYWLPGNHDAAPLAEQTLRQYEWMRPLTRLETDDWLLLALDSVQPGTDDGHIGEAAVERFRQQLAAADKPAKRSAVLLHHHPAAVGTPLLDSCMLRNTDRFWDLMAELPNLQLLLCGHAHGDYRLQARGVALEVCPATCFQWRKGTAALDTQDARGYKVLAFDAAGFRSMTVMV
ncbi:metallophosphoesterase [Chromobacterium alticapitis]|uniref:metallophosphoesterase n=1 Tax=Chromobacterium alticapitis TaxID=2073169 RepID=UPI001304BF4C|nr:metallophosphoesterase [Chromobacterium alticapitis]